MALFLYLVHYFFDYQADRTQLPSIPARISGIYRSGGIKAFFAGVVPRTLWISAGGSIFLGIYELVVVSPTLS